MKRVVSYGGGVDSTAMTLLLLKQNEPIDLVIFADTGGEWPETYEFIKMFDSYLHEHAGIGITRVQSKVGPMYPYMIERGWVPSRTRPSHIERWKVRPIFGFLNEWRKGDTVEVCIGIDWDERDRMNTPRYKWVVNRYPLCDARIGRRGAEDLIREAGLPIPIKSGCFFCPFQSKARWLRLKRLHPDLFEQAVQLEKKNKFYPMRTLFNQGPLENLDGKKVIRSTKRVLFNEELEELGQETWDIFCSSYGMCGK